MPTSFPFWISKLNVSAQTAAKVAGKHGYRVRDIRDAVVCRRGLRAHRDVDHRGLRLFVRAVVDGNNVFIVVRPSEDVDVYNLVTVYLR